MNREKRREAVERQKRRARRERRALLLILLVLAALIAVGVFLLHEKSPAPSPQSTDTGSARPSQSVPQTTAVPQETEATEATLAPQTTEAAETEASTAASTEASPADESWKLVLVNATHPLPEGFTVTLKELRNGHHVDERIYPELQQMFDDAR